MKQEQLTEILENHALWIRGKGGRRADLSGANLNGADLSGADLRCADLSHASLRWSDLRCANLSGANLSGADLHLADLRWASMNEAVGIRHAYCGWHGHGERGRQLLAVEIAGEIWFFCGCFWGTAKELEQYIEAGTEKHKASRRKAMAFVLSCFE